MKPNPWPRSAGTGVGLYLHGSAPLQTGNLSLMKQENWDLQGGKIESRDPGDSEWRRVNDNFDPTSCVSAT